jgi:hypothetical protein
MMWSWEHIELHKQLGIMQKRIEVLECEVAHKQEALVKIETTEAKKKMFQFHGDIEHYYYFD